MRSEWTTPVDYPSAGLRKENKEKRNFYLWSDLNLTCDLLTQKCCTQKIDHVVSFRMPFFCLSTTNGSEVRQGEESAPPPEGYGQKHLLNCHHLKRWRFTAVHWDQSKLPSSSRPTVLTISNKGASLGGRCPMSLTSTNLFNRVPGT